MHPEQEQDIQNLCHPEESLSVAAEKRIHF